MPNPFIITLLSIFARALVMSFAGALGIGPEVHAYIDAHLSEFNQEVVGALLGLGTLLYAWYKQYTHKQILMTALASPVPMSESDAKAMVKDTSVITPSVTTSKSEIPV